MELDQLAMYRVWLKHNHTCLTFTNTYNFTNMFGGQRLGQHELHEKVRSRHNLHNLKSWILLCNFIVCNNIQSLLLFNVCSKQSCKHIQKFWSYHVIMLVDESHQQHCFKRNFMCLKWQLTSDMLAAMSCYASEDGWQLCHSSAMSRAVMIFIHVRPLESTKFDADCLN